MSLFRKPLAKDTYNEELLEEIANVKQQMDTAYLNFQHAMDPDLIDCYIYEVNSSLKRYKYLLEQAAKLNLPPEESKKNEKINTTVIPKIHGLSFDLPYSLLTGLFRR